MLSGAAKRLTDRQRAVMERIDRRVPIKVIALELGVSETRINQHIRALKAFYDAGSLGDLVENYRATLPPAALLRCTALARARGRELGKQLEAAAKQQAGS